MLGGPLSLPATIMFGHVQASKDRRNVLLHPPKTTSCKPSTLDTWPRRHLGAWSLSLSLWAPTAEQTAHPKGPASALEGRARPSTAAQGQNHSARSCSLGSPATRRTNHTYSPEKDLYFRRHPWGKSGKKDITPSKTRWLMRSGAIRRRPRPS